MIAHLRQVRQATGADVMDTVATATETVRIALRLSGTRDHDRVRADAEGVLQEVIGREAWACLRPRTRQIIVLCVVTEVLKEGA